MKVRSKAKLTDRQVEKFQRQERDLQVRIQNAVDKPHRARMRKAKEDGVSAEERDRLEAKFRAERPALIEAEEQARMEAYRRSPEGIEMARLSAEADLAYRESLRAEAPAQE